MRLDIEIDDALLSVCFEITGISDGEELVTQALRCLVDRENERTLRAAMVGVGADTEKRDVSNPSPSKASVPLVEAGDVIVGEVVDLAVLEVKQSSARCRLIGSRKEVTLRSGEVWKFVPGEVVSLLAEKQWRYARHPYLSGKVRSMRLDINALELRPLVLEDMGMWDPAEEYWGEEQVPLEAWAEEIIAAGPRPMFEMEQILPGDSGWDHDPITDSVDLKHAGQYGEARELLQKLCREDLRCLDAHAHLGNLVFDQQPEMAIRHYEVGFRIGELSLDPNVNCALPWVCINNRPFLRCMQGYGLCLWRLEHFEEAAGIFNRMLWFNPNDNQGIRFLFDEVTAGREWVDEG